MTHDPARCAAMLLADGYCIVEDVLSPDTVSALETELAPRFEATPFCEGGFYGARTKRFGALLRRSRHAAALVRHPLILTIAETRSEEHTSELQSLMRTSYAVFCL